MWPFTSRRIMSSRWWALGFVVFVCWQAVDFIGATPSPAANAVDGTNADNAAGDDTPDDNAAAASEAQLHDMVNSLKSM